MVFVLLFLISVPCTGADWFKCSQDKSDEQSPGNSNASCDDLGEEKEDGLFDAFVPREIAFEPEEEDVDGDSVNKSCEKQFHKSRNNSSHSSMT